MWKVYGVLGCLIFSLFIVCKCSPLPLRLLSKLKAAAAQTTRSRSLAAASSASLTSTGPSETRRSPRAFASMSEADDARARLCPQLHRRRVRDSSPSSLASPWLLRLRLLSWGLVAWMRRYIWGALNLYIDIIQLFILILMLTGGRRD